jgi:hypothetical protein
MKKVLTLILFLTTHLCSQIKVQNFVDKKEVYLGDVVNYHIIIEHPKNIELSKFEIYNVIKDTTGAENFVLYSTKINKTKKLFSNKIIQEFVFKLIPVQLETLKINEINIGYINLQTNENKIIIVPSIELSVKPYPKPKKKVFDGEIIDIKGQIWIRNYFWLILFILLILSVLTWVFYQYRLKPQMQTQNANVGQQVDIKEVALKKLDDLWQKNYLSLGLIKEFYFELTEIVRWYIEKKFEVNALELTTEELFNVLKKKVDKKYNLELKSFLDNADLAKFAKYRPDEKQIVQDFEIAKKLII